MNVAHASHMHNVVLSCTKVSRCAHWQATSFYEVAVTANRQCQLNQRRLIRRLSVSVTAHYRCACQCQPEFLGTAPSAECPAARAHCDSYAERPCRRQIAFAAPPPPRTFRRSWLCYAAVRETSKSSHEQRCPAPRLTWVQHASADTIIHRDTPKPGDKPRCVCGRYCALPVKHLISPPPNARMDGRSHHFPGGSPTRGAKC